MTRFLAIVAVVAVVLSATGCATTRGRDGLNGSRSSANQVSNIGPNHGYNHPGPGGS